MGMAAAPLLVEGAVTAGTMTAAEIAAAEAVAAQAAAAAQAASAAQAATNASILSTIAPTAAPAATTAATTAASALPAAATPMAAGPATIGLGGAPAGTVLGSGAGAGISALPAAATPMAAGPATVGLGGAPAGTVLGSGSGTGIQALADEIGIQSAMPSATPPWATQTMMPSTPGIPPEAPIYEAPTLSFPPGGAPPQVPYDPTAPMASYPGSTPPAQPLYPQPVTPQVGQAASAMNDASGATSRITEAMQNPMTNSPDLGPAQSSMNYPPGPDRLPVQAAEQTPFAKSAMNEVAGGQPTPYEWAGGNANQIASAATPAAEPNFLQELYKDFKGMSVPNKILTGMAASSAYDTLTKKPYEPKKYKSTFKPGLYTGYQPVQPTPYTPQYAHGGLADLGGYSDGGRMLKGPGDGMSDDIPATIANKQPARLANEEFVIPADVVSHLGNGSSEAGAKVLYKMMDRVRKARTGSKKQGKQINPEKYLA